MQTSPKVIPEMVQRSIVDLIMFTTYDLDADSFDFFRTFRVHFHHQLGLLKPAALYTNPTLFPLTQRPISTDG